MFIYLYLYLYLIFILLFLFIYFIFTLSLELYKILPNIWYFFKDTEHFSLRSRSLRQSLESQKLSRRVCYMSQSIDVHFIQISIDFCIWFSAKHGFLRCVFYSSQFRCRKDASLFLMRVAQTLTDVQVHEDACRRIQFEEVCTGENSADRCHQRLLWSLAVLWIILFRIFWKNH